MSNLEHEKWQESRQEELDTKLDEYILSHGRNHLFDAIDHWVNNTPMGKAWYRDLLDKLIADAPENDEAHDDI